MGVYLSNFGDLNKNHRLDEKNHMLDDKNHRLDDIVKIKDSNPKEVIPKLEFSGVK